METKNVIPNFQKTGQWYEFYSGDSITVTSTLGEIALKQGEYRLYTDVKLNKPDITVGLVNDIEISNSDLRVFPNPSSGVFSFSFNDDSQNQKFEIKIYNLNGQLVSIKSGLQADTTIEIDLSKLGNGLYFYELNSGNQRFTGRLIKN